MGQKLPDDPVEAFAGDIFLGLDLQAHVVTQQAGFYQHLRDIGVKVYFVVHDLLPILLPKAFPEGTSTAHEAWLSTVGQVDGAVCVSRAVADELAEWLKVYGRKRLRPFTIGFSHHGADIQKSVPSKGLPSVAGSVLEKLKSRPTFLMVGTIEPRKGHLQTIAAFDQLWARGIDVNLVIVGAEGWRGSPKKPTISLIVSTLRDHPEKDRRLFWLEGISDEYLEKIYAASDCLIMPSEGEGFGLPLIEAALHKIRIIARDIPVFREVAGEHAFYFTGSEPDLLAGAVLEWLELDRAGQAPQSSTMRWLTWKQSTQNLLDVIVGGNWYEVLKHEDMLCYLSNDDRQCFATAGARTLDGLMALEGRDFIICAYQTLLGRVPDAAGVTYNLGLLRAGMSKIQILAQLRLSAECKAHGADLRGLDAAIRRHRRGKLPIFGRLFQLIDGADGSKPAQLGSRGKAVSGTSTTSDKSEPPSASGTKTIAAVRTLDQLLACEGKAFIVCAYQTLLDRDPDPTGFNYYLGRLRAGIPKIQILAQLRLSVEGKAQGACLPGLDAAIGRCRRGNLPIIGSLFRLINGMDGNKSAQLRLRGIENQLFLLGEENERLEKALGELRELVIQQTQTVIAATRSAVRSRADLPAASELPEPERLKDLSPHARDIYSQLRRRRFFMSQKTTW
jgi:glycosyltransferase involved in cell wall biosynthesis